MIISRTSALADSVLFLGLSFHQYCSALAHTSTTILSCKMTYISRAIMFITLHVLAPQKVHFVSISCSIACSCSSEN